MILHIPLVIVYFFNWVIKKSIEVKMEKWEYKVVDFQSGGFMGGLLNTAEIEAKLNELGKDGWELVSSYSTNAGYGATRKLVYTLKKETIF